MMSGKQSVECKLLTVSDIIAQRRLEVVHLLKIDVEGAEAKVLRGAVEILERDRPMIVLEVHGEEVGRECQELFTRHSYTLDLVEGSEQYGHYLAKPRETRL